jgi:hypothetical protein
VAAPATTTALYAERFVEHVPGWPDNASSTAWFSDGGYRLFARRPGSFVAIDAPLDGPPAADVIVSTRMSKVGGPEGGEYGLIVRDQDPLSTRDGLNQSGRYIVFEVSDRGTISIRQRAATRWIDIVPWTSSEAVHTGVEPNDLTAMAIGSALRFEVNGTIVAQLSYPGMPLQGGVGVFVGGDRNQVAVDWLRVEAPDEPQ